MHPHRSRAGMVYPDVVAGSSGVERITVLLNIENRNRDVAIGTTLRISIPPQFEFDTSNDVSVNY